MADKVAVLLVGIGGYASGYAKGLMENSRNRNIELAGVVDPNPQISPLYEQLSEQGVPFFPSVEAFFAQGKADLTIVSSPIQFHKHQSCVALKHGSHVLCEKPAAATIQDALEMKRVSEEQQRFLAIGFNWSYDPQLLQLKADILNGRFGRPQRLKTLVLWSRNEAYFNRNRWAGKIQTESGEWVLDSVAHNATSHYLHNMLFILGEQAASAVPAWVEAELYRANPIENFDTCATRVMTEDGVEVLFYAAHPVSDNEGPKFVYEFEKAVITYDSDVDPHTFHVQFHDGTTDTYTNAVQDSFEKIWLCIDAVADGGQYLPCPIDAATAQLITINGIQQSVPQIVPFPAEQISQQGSPALTVVAGLADALKAAFEAGKLPHELDVAWAQAGKRIDLKDYRHFSLD